jgi:hypothetical protein
MSCFGLDQGVNESGIGLVVNRRRWVPMLPSDAGSREWPTMMMMMMMMMMMIMVVTHHDI